jgi:hypothetical protein
MRIHATIISAALALSFAICPGMARATLIEVNDTTDTMQLLIDSVVVVTQSEGFTGGQLNSIALLRNDFPVHPPREAFVRVNFLEPAGEIGGGVVSDTFDLRMTPNNDGRTSTLSLTFQSDVDDGVGVLAIGGTPVPFNVTELADGNVILLNNAGMGGVQIVDANRNTIPAGDFGGVLSITVRSDAIPEPSTLLLLASGLFAVALLARRRNAAPRV